MTVTIILPGIRALSRNQTTGHYINYMRQLTIAENWMVVYGYRYTHHFEDPVTVTIDAYFDTQHRSSYIDAPNIDDKIFTDILIRYKAKKLWTGKWEAGRKIYTFQKIERKVWFIEDDNPNCLVSVTKRSHPGCEDKVVITINDTQHAS